MKAVLAGIRQRFSSVDQVSTETVSNRVSDPDERRVLLLLLDTRQREEYDVSHLPGATLVDYNEAKGGDGAQIVDTLITPHVQRLMASPTWHAEAEDSGGPSEGRAVVKVVCYCSVGYRSSHLAQKLRPLLPGNVSVHNMEGSAFQWCNEGRPLVDGEGGPTTYCHPYSALWQYLLHADHRRWNASNL